MDFHLKINNNKTRLVVNHEIPFRISNGSGSQILSSFQIDN